MVAAKPALHIYRIRDHDGHERDVHRNLLLQVSFLPLNDTLVDIVVPLPTPAPSVANFHLYPIGMILECAAAATEPSLACSLLNVSE